MRSNMKAFSSQRRQTSSTAKLCAAPAVSAGANRGKILLSILPAGMWKAETLTVLNLKSWAPSNRSDQGPVRWRVLTEQDSTSALRALPGRQWRPCMQSSLGLRESLTESQQVSVTCMVHAIKRIDSRDMC